MQNNNLDNNIFNIDAGLLELAEQAEKECAEQFAEIDRICEINSQKVLKAFADNHVSEVSLKGTTGYGYSDEGRDKLDKVFAQALGGEDAVVRHTFVNGTHTLSTMLFAILRPGDTLLSCTGDVYDTLESVIGIGADYKKGDGSLKDFGINFDKVPLLNNQVPDYEKIAEKAKTAKVAYIQRSRGYSLRPSLNVEIIGKIAQTAKSANPDIIVMVDNCYGEFVEEKEPVAVGADLMAGSLIKNLGGGIASTGGYICGKRELIEKCADRLACVGTGKEVGCTLGQNREMLLGFFLSPSVVANAVKSSVFACSLMNKMGYKTTPAVGEKRTDIIASIELKTPENVVAFCQGIQAGSPVDSFVTPEAWDMPGYESQVIMAAGTFTMGASIELSADAPMREPYAVWLQGGLTYHTAKTGILIAANKMLNK